MPLIFGIFADHDLYSVNESCEHIDKKRPEVVQDLPDIVAATAQHGEDGIAAQPLEGASCKAAVAFHVSDFGFYGAAPSEQFFEFWRQATFGA